MKYNVIDESQIFIQNGNGKTKYAMIRNTGYQFIINNCCENIINEVLLNNDTEIVLKKIKEKYVNEEETSLRADLDSIANMLRIFGIISFEEAGECKVGRSDIGALSESEYQEASEMIKEELKSNRYNIGASADFYTAVNIRSQIMNNNEYYYRYCDEKGKILAIISIVPNLSSSVVIINSIIFNSSIRVEQAKELMVKFINTILKSMINKVNKVRMMIYENEKGKKPCITEVLKEIDFNIEAVLEKEIGDRSVYFWTMKVI